MSVKNMIMAGVALAVVGAAAPAFAQDPPKPPALSITPTSANAAVTATVAPACALTGSLTPFAVTVDPLGIATATGGTQSVTVTCNTRDGNITLGSNDMANTTAPAIVETSTFTNTISFNAFALGTGGSGDDWALDSKTGGQSGISTIGHFTNRRVRTLALSVTDVSPQGRLLPVAGSYSGTMCLTVSPVGTMTGSQVQDGNNSCNSAGGVNFTGVGSVGGTGTATTTP